LYQTITVSSILRSRSSSCENGKRELSVKEISGLLLKEIKIDAEKVLDCKVEEAVQGDTHFGGDDFDDRIVLFWIEGISGINRTRYFTRF
jgi:molecular chaperone DnaK (HSP70)